MAFLLHHLLAKGAERTPDALALGGEGGETLSYAGALARVAALAGELRTMGLAPGERVAIQLEPTLALPLAILAVSAAAGVFVPVHHGLLRDQVRHILADSGAAVLVTDAKRLAALGPLAETAPALRAVVVEGEPLEPVPDGIAVASLPGAMEGEAPLPADRAIGRDLAAIIYTSGSTGRPKGVMLSHANLLAGARIVADYLSIAAADRLLAALPFSFDAGLNQLTGALHAGASTHMIRFRFARDIVSRVARDGITGLAGVPPLWAMLAQPSAGLSKAAGLRYVTNTGGAMPAHVLAALREALPRTDVVLMYGLTEAFRSTWLPPAELDRRPGSMGRAIPDTEIMVVTEDGTRCAPGEVGELVHRGPTVSLGYWNRPDATARVLRPHPFPPPGEGVRETVCYSGDLVREDEDGYLTFVGRRDNQIKSAGFRISATEVEEAIAAVAPVRQVAVVGVPDAVLGQHIVAFAVAREGAALEPGAILAACAGRMPRHMVPRRLVVLDDMPLTASGKTDLARLRALALGGDDAPSGQQAPAARELVHDG